MLVPQWEVFLAYTVEIAVGLWLVFVVTLDILKWRHLEGKAKEMMTLNMSKAKAKFFQVKLVRDDENEEEPVHLNDLKPKQAQDNVARGGEGLSGTGGLSNGSVVTEMPESLRTDPVPKNVVATVGVLEPVGEKKSVEIAEGGKPNLDSTPSKPSQLPPSATTQAYSRKAQALRDRLKKKNESDN